MFGISTQILILVWLLLGHIGSLYYFRAPTKKIVKREEEAYIGCHLELSIIYGILFLAKWVVLTLGGVASLLYGFRSYRRKSKFQASFLRSMKTLLHESKER